MAQEEYCPLSLRIANYVMTVSLNPTKKLISGSEVLTWEHISSDFIPDIYLHFYMNAFSCEKSTFMTKSGNRFHGRKLERGKRGALG